MPGVLAPLHRPGWRYGGWSGVPSPLDPDTWRPHCASTAAISRRELLRTGSGSELGLRWYGPLITAGDAAVLSAQGVLRQCKEEKRCAAAQEQLSRLTPSQRRKLGSLGGWDRYRFVGRI